MVLRELIEKPGMCEKIYFIYKIDDIRGFCAICLFEDKKIMSKLLLKTRLLYIIFSPNFKNIRHNLNINQLQIFFAGVIISLKGNIMLLLVL